MNCEIIAVGDEVLTGDIVNTNAREIAAGLEDTGVRVRRQIVTSDNPAEIRQTLAEAFDRSDVILTIGGLGPTYDDITRESAAEQMGVPLVRDPETERRIREYFTATGRELTDNNWRQAMIPEGGEALVNLNGTAPGIWLEKDGKILVQLPGPPRECLPIFRESVLPRLRERTGQKRVTRSVRIFGIPEAAAESRLHDRMTASRNPVIAPYVKDGEVEIRLRAWADTEEAAYALTEAPAREIAAEFGDHAYSLNGESLSEVLVRTLRENGLHATAAESCTGGMVTAAITSVAGASEVFDGGVCSYANTVKAGLLGVSEEILREHGAVSEACAAEMARGVRKLMGADLAVSVTGIAGPGGGTPEKPVGTVCFGVSTPDGEYTLTRHYRSQGSSVRESNRTRSALEAQFQLLLAARRLGKKQ